jgi:hypothetical protein
VPKLAFVDAQFLPIRMLVHGFASMTAVRVRRTGAHGKQVGEGWRMPPQFYVA